MTAHIVAHSAINLYFHVKKQVVLVLALEVAPSPYTTWLAQPTLLPIISWKEGVRHSSHGNYSKEKGREPAVIGGKELGREKAIAVGELERERELEFPTIATGELERERVTTTIELELPIITIIGELRALPERRELFLVVALV